MAVGNLHGIIGAAGIGAKYIAESAIGVQYGMPAVKRKQTVLDYSSGESSNGDSVGSIDAPSFEANSVDMVDGQPGSTVGGGVGESGQPGAPILIGAGHNPGVTYKFTKKWQISTGSIQFTNKEIPTTWQPLFRNPDQKALMVTPLATIDPNNLAWFLSPKEHSELPNYSFAKSCKIKVRPLGYRLPFETNASVTSSANSQNLIQIAWSTGLNHKFPIFQSGVTVDQNNPTLVNSFSTVANLRASLYGTQSIGANVGVPRLLNFNTHIVINNKQTADGNTYSPNLLKAMTVANIIDVRGTVIHDFTYNYKVGILKFGNSSICQMNTWQPADLTDSCFATQADITGSTGQSNFRLHDTQRVWIPGDDNASTVPFIPYNNCIEKAEYVRIDPTAGHLSDLTPPTVCFGIMPVQSNSPYAPVATFSPAVAFWEVETEFDVQCMTDFTSGDGACGPWPFQYDPRIIRKLQTYGEGSWFSSATNSLVINGRRLWNSDRSHPAVNNTPPPLITILNLPAATMSDIAEEPEEHPEEEAADDYQPIAARTRSTIMDIDMPPRKKKGLLFK